MVEDITKSIVTKKGDELVVRAEREMVQPTAIVALDLLEEIADRLATLEQLTRAEHPQGRAAMRKFSCSGTTKKLMRYSSNFRHSVSIWNDGPDKVYVRVNDPIEDNPIELNSKEKCDIDMKTGIIEELYFNCDEGGSASGRIVGKY